MSTESSIPDRRSSLEASSSSPRTNTEGFANSYTYDTNSGPTRSKLLCSTDSKNIDSASGHTSKYAKFDVNGPNVIHHENIYLKPVHKTTVRHVEIEEIERVTTIDRHIHHIQYHFQNVIKPDAERERHSYYELVDPRLNTTESEPVFHQPIHHKLQYQTVSREEFMNQQTAIRPGAESDHFEEHISIGGVPRPLATGSTTQAQGTTMTGTSVGSMEKPREPSRQQYPTQNVGTAL